MKRLLFILLLAVSISVLSACGVSANNENVISTLETENDSISESATELDEQIGSKVFFSMDGEILNNGYRYTVVANNQSGYNLIGFSIDITLLNDNGKPAASKHFDYDQTFDSDSEVEFPFTIDIIANDYTIDWTYTDTNENVSTELEDSVEESISIDISSLSDEEIYELAVTYYDSGLYSKAKFLFSQITGYENSSKYISDCEIMLDYEGVYKYSLLKDGWYYVIFGNTLSKFDFTKEAEGKATAKIDTVVLYEYEGEPALINELYVDNLDYSMIVYYVLTTDENGEKCIKEISPFDRTDSDHAIYNYTQYHTKEELVERTQKSQNMSVPEIGMTESEVLDSTWGEPEKINKTTTKYGVHEQWVYSDNRYIYFDDGIVTAIQE